MIWWLIVIGLCFITLGTFLTILGQMISSDRKSAEITHLSQENIRLSSELKKLNQEIAATVTGGDSFCYLFPSPSFGKLNTIDFNLNHKGEYPVYEVFIRVWDASCLNQIDYGQIFEKHLGYKTKIVSPEESKKMEEDPEIITKQIKVDKEIHERMRNCLIFQEKLGTVAPNTPTTIMDTPLISCTVPKGVDLTKFSQEYSVEITARNGRYNQKILLDIRNKRWHIYSKVEKIISESKRVVVREYESVDSEGFTIKLIK